MVIKITAKIQFIFELKFYLLETPKNTILHTRHCGLDPQSLENNAFNPKSALDFLDSSFQSE